MERTGPILTVRVEREPEGRLRVLSPAVGLWSANVAGGQLVAAGVDAGILQQLNRRFRLVLPENSEGRVDQPGAARQVAVEYGQVLFHIVLLSKAASGKASASHEPAAQTARDKSERGGLAVQAPTHGVFYRRPAPGAPPFVEVGSRIRNGEPLGLIEVMKTFHQILYGGPGLPEEAVVTEICCTDGQEVSAGQALLRVR